MRFRTAVDDDLDQVAALLAEAELPPVDASQSLSNLIVGFDDSQLVGCVGLEVYARTGLVRSMVVTPDRRANGLGRELFRSLLARAYELGLKELFLLTVDAEGFFAKLGFTAVPRDRAPASIQDSTESRELCPETATLMHLSLA
jgi:amino-acid N-acetyltransferase